MPSRTPRGKPGQIARAGFLELAVWLPRRINGGRWPALTKVTSCVLTVEQPGAQRHEAVEQAGFLHELVELVDGLAGSVSVSMQKRASELTLAMSRAAGTPLPATSPT